MNYLNLKILLLSICFAGTICPSFAQQKDVIDILHADTYAVNMKSNIDSLLGNVRLKHKNMLMFCGKYQHIFYKDAVLFFILL